MHRDIKPSNLLVFGPVHRPRVKLLTDFGLAKSFAETDGLSITSPSPGRRRRFDRLHLTGSHSPVQRRPRARRHLLRPPRRCFYLLTNRYPYLGFDPREPTAPTRSSLQNPPVPLRAFRPDAPEGVERALLKALQKQPRDRWKSARAMAEALRPFAAPSSS